MASYNLGTASGKIIVDGSGAASGFGVATTAANAFFDVIKGQVTALDEMGTKLLKIGATGAVGMGLAVRTAASFEARISAIKAVSGATAAQMDKVTAAALRIGKDTVFSASEAAQAIEELVKAGISVNDALGGAADATVALAAAGEIALPQAATIAANAMNNFGMTGKQMPHIADLIAGAANASAIDVEQFGMSLSQSGAVASISGMKFDDLAVAIAEMGNAGIKGSDAGTSLKTMLTNLIPTTDQQKTMFQELGLAAVNANADMSKLTNKGIKPQSMSWNDVTAALEKYVAKTGGAKVGSAENTKAAQKLGSQMGVLKNQFFDAQGNVKSLADVQQILQNSTKNLTSEQKLNALNVLFGTDAIRASAVMAKNGADGYNKMSAAMGKVGAGDVAATRMDNLNGSIEQLKGSFETVMITIGTMFIPIARKLVDAVTRILNAFLSMPSGVQKAMGILFALGTAGSVLTGILIKLLMFLPGLIGKFLGFKVIGAVFDVFKAGIMTAGGLSARFAAMGGVSKTLATMLGRIEKVGAFLFKQLIKFPRLLSLIRTISSVMFGPWGIAIALIVAGAILLYNKWKPFHDLVNRIAASIKSGLITAFNFLKDAIRNVIEGFNDAEGHGSGVMEIFLRIGDAARTVWEALKSLAQMFVSSVLPVLKEAGGQVMAALTKAFLQIKDAVVNSLMPALQQMWQIVVTQIVPALKDLWNAIQPVVMFLLKLVGIIVGVVLVAWFLLYKMLITYILPALIKVAAFIIGVVVPVLATIISVLIRVIVWVVKFAVTLVSWIVRAFVAVVKAIKTSLLWIWNAIVTTFNNVVGWIQTAMAWISSAISTAWNAIKAAWSTTMSWIAGVVSTVWNFIVGIIQASMKWIHDVVWAGLNFIKGIWQAVWGLFGPVVLAVWGLIKAAVAFGFAAIVYLIKVAIATILAIWTSVWNGIFAVAKYIIDGLVIFMRGAWNIISSVATTVWKAIASFFTTIWNSIYAAVSTAVKRVWSVITTVFTAVRGFITNIWNSVFGFFQGIWNKIYAFMVIRVNNIKSNVAAAWNWIRSTTAAVWNAIFAAVSGPLSRVWSRVTSTASNIRNAISGAWSTVTSLTSAAWGKLAGYVSTGISAMMTWITGIPGRISSAFSNAKTWLLDAGKRIIQGLVDGISSMINKVTDKLKFLTNLIPKSKGPISVDRKLLTANGEMIMQSLVQGFQNGEGDVLRTLKNLTSTIPRKVQVDMNASMTAAGSKARAASLFGDAAGNQAPGIAVKVEVNAPQNMSPEQVARATASRLGYALSGFTKPIPTPVGAR